MNKDTAIRKSVFDALDGNLTYNSIDVPVYDSKLSGDDGVDVYVIITNQDGQYAGNFIQQAWISTISMTIISVQIDGISKDIVDNVEEQIHNIIAPSVTTTGLAQQTGWKMDNVILLNYNDAADLGDVNVVSKTVTYQLTITKTN